MKKFIKSISCLVLAFVFGLALVACKNTDDGTEKKDPSKDTPTVSVSIAENLYFAGDNLSTVSISLDDGGTEGSVAWKNASEKLKAGTNSYQYTFVPNDSKKYSAVTKTVQVFAIGNIYKTASNKFGYIDFQNNYIEFERTGNTLSYVSNFDAGTGVVIYENQEIVLKTTSETNKYSILISSDSIQIYDYETGDLVSTIGDLKKYTYPEYLGTYKISKSNNDSTLTLSLSAGRFTYELNYFSDYGNGTDVGTFEFDTATGDISFNSTTNSDTWFGSFNKTENSITTEFFLISGEKFIKG